MYCSVLDSCLETDVFITKLFIYKVWESVETDTSAAKTVEKPTCLLYKLNISSQSDNALHPLEK